MHFFKYQQLSEQSKLGLNYNFKTIIIYIYNRKYFRYMIYTLAREQIKLVLYII
jgi:hypothetical protein